MGGDESKAAKLNLLGGELCLDFANTLSNHRSEQPTEYLNSFADLVAWSQHAGLLTNRTAQQLLDEATRQPVAAKQVHQRALAIRESIYRIFTMSAENRLPQATDLKLLNQALADFLVHSQVISTKDGFVWDWSNENAMDRMLWSITRSAADLLTSPNLDRVRQCGDDACGWLFIDTSKNHSRRWCAMNDCGNRAKARRYYTRLRAASKSRKASR